MKRILLRVAYDGTNYSGWQIQDNAETIEGVLTLAMEKLFDEKIEVIGASRTDAGVHAYGNVAVFDTETRIPPEKIAYALNRGLPNDIRVLSSVEVDKEFHPRYVDSVKTYEYRIENSDIFVPTKERFCHHIYGKIDLQLMKNAAKKLVGTHDFSAFCSAGSQVKTKVRTITDIQIIEEPFLYANKGNDIVIRVSGTGFLYNMVRIIAGTLIEVGMKRREVHSIDTALSSLNRMDAGPTAPAKGLTLMGISYKDYQVD